jgi:hypothetical protein
LDIHSCDRCQRHLLDCPGVLDYSGSVEQEKGSWTMMGEFWFLVLVGVAGFVLGCWLKPTVMKWLGRK